MSSERSFANQILKAVQHPGRLFAHVRRVLRNRRLQSDDPVEFYRRVVDDNARSDPDRAIGSDSPEHWLNFGEMQFKYLVDHGLSPEHRFLEVGCGNLRLGWRVIQYLQPGHYTGIDISEKILASARNKVVDYGLQAKRPGLFFVADANYRFLEADTFDFAYAHAVFTQMPMEVVSAVLSGVWRVLKPGGIFEFTFNATEGPARHYLGEDYFHPRSAILDAVAAQGMVAELMTDWPYHQEKIRARKP
jgi:ubiquinone/menaquinone biosynthesis C-methylase UbiE